VRVILSLGRVPDRLNDLIYRGRWCPSHHLPCTIVLNSTCLEISPTVYGTARDRPMLRTFLRVYYFQQLKRMLTLNFCSAFFAFLVSLFLPPSLPVQVFLYVSGAIPPR
jgi:hypothetical protein